MQTQFSETRWPDLTRFRDACLHERHEEMQEIAERRHDWYVNENPDEFPMERLARIYQSQYYAATNDRESLKRLLDGDPDLVNQGWTAQNWLPITQACSHGSRALIEFLLERGADPTLMVGDLGEQGTVVEMARGGGHDDLARWLEGIIEEKSH